MNIALIGSGGREHAGLQKLHESKKADTIYVLPGNAGMADIGTCVPIGATDINGIAKWAKTHNIDFAVVTPDDPLALGCVDALEALGIPCGGGLSMLVAQAVRAEEHFLGKTIPEGETERVLALLRRELTNIVLIGMPGSGKSSVGAALAHLSGRETIDLDAEIIKKAGCSIPEIFKAQGETGFRAIEAECAAEAGRRSGCIIICGGGIVKTSANKNALRQNGRVYQLLRPLELLPTDGRPLSQGADLQKMWAERKPLYEAFRDAAIKNEGSIDEAAEAIRKDFDQSDES